MELDRMGDVATWAGALISLLAAVWAGRAAGRAEALSSQANQLAYNAWVDQYFEGVRAWADEVSNAIQMACHLGSETAGEQRTEQLIQLGASLASLADRGRWHFPNEWQEHVGMEKPAAYRGYRRPVLTSVVRAYQVLQKINGMTQEEYHTLMVKHQREFVSHVQEVLDPRARDKEAARITRAFADVARMRELKQDS